MSHRLPTHVRPKEIDLSFDLDPQRPTFRGSASYALALARRCRKLELHSAGLQVSSVRVHVGDRILRGRVENRPDQETIVLRFDQLLPVGELQLELRFRGRVRRDLRGLYGDGAGVDAWLASQLCPTDARRLFPCFDEPGIKARYRISVLAPRDLAVLSNSPIESEERVDATQADKRGVSSVVSRRLVRFEWTPPLSSYLVAVAVGPFEASEIRTCGATPIRIWALPGRRHLMPFALEAAAESLERLQRWFDRPHPYAKLDLVALPAFAFGAMENAGAVFFRDSILLLDAENASLEDRMRTAEVVAHELSHMWFGNSVTMKWWNDLWLNEAFATWMAYEIVEMWRPEWRIWLDFAQRREEALVLDALSSSHPIAPPIRSAAEAQENFDAITYTKGAAVLRMLERYLGADVFREGIRLYIRRHADANAEASDLWDALTEVSNEAIEAIISPWILLTGYPLISIRRPEGKPIKISQERFLALPARSKKIDPARWAIPLVIRAGQSSPGTGSTREITERTRLLLSKRHASLESAHSPFAWIYPNAQEAGFFRMDQGERGHRELTAHVSALSATEQIGFLGNQWALCRAGTLTIDHILDLIASLRLTPDAEVLSRIENILTQIERRLLRESAATTEQSFRAWICRIFETAIEELGPRPRREEDDRTRLRRAELFSIVGGLGRSEDLVGEAERKVAQHFAEGIRLDGELAGPMLRIAAGNGGAMLHAGLCHATRHADTPQARRLYLFALAGFVDPSLIDKSFDAALDPDLAPAPDRAQLIAELLASPVAAARTWRRLQKGWKQLEKQMPPIVLARLAAATSFALPSSASKEIGAFYSKHSLAAGSRVLSQVREELRIAARFERAAGPDLGRALASWSDSSN